jgi:hypothetical protein
MAVSANSDDETAVGLLAAGHTEIQNTAPSPDFKRQSTQNKAPTSRTNLHKEPIS